MVIMYIIPICDQWFSWFHFISFISIQPAIHVTSDTSKCNIVQYTVLSH